MGYKQHKGNLRGQIKNKVERKLYNKRIRSEEIDIDMIEKESTKPIKGMEFIEAENNENLWCRLVSEDGRIEIGVYTVMFGYRVRAGFVGDFFCHLDYCCGDKQEMVEYIYSGVKAILENTTGDKPFSKFPHQNIKPFFNDQDNFKGFSKLIEESLKGENLNIVKLLPLHEIRREQLKFL